MRHYHYESHGGRSPTWPRSSKPNFAKRLKILNGLVLFERICKIWTGSLRGSS